MTTLSPSRKYLAEFVYGSIDGTVTTFAIISAISGAGLSPAIILILGFANVFADGFSMAAGNFLSEESNEDVGLTEPGGKKPLRTALVTFISFVVVGTIPILPFIYAYTFVSSVDAFKVSIVATVIVFILIGFVRGKISHKSSWRTAIETVFVGAVASVIAYASGILLKGVM